MINLKTGKRFDGTDGVSMTRGGFLKGILASGIAPSITLGVIGLAGRADGGAARGMMRCVGGGMTARGGMPYDAEVDCIISNGNQYIDLEISSPNGFLCELKVLRSSNQADANVYVVGSHNVSSPYGRNGFQLTSNGTFGMGTGDSQIVTSYSFDKNTVYIVNASSIKGSSYCDVNGSSKGYSTDSSSRSSNNILIFNEQYGLNRGVAGFCGNLYYIKINTSSVEMDLIPVVKNSVAFLYDKKSGTKFGNANVGHSLGYKIGSYIKNPT